VTPRSIIYFDNAATTGKKPDTVREAICDCLANANANPGRSGHSLAVKAAEIIYNARETIGEFFNFPATEQIVLTKNATEALNIAIYGTLAPGDEVIVSSMEHNSVMRPLSSLERDGIIKLKKIKADEDGAVHPQMIREAISENVKLIVVTSASNVTGTIMDLEGIYRVSHDAGKKLLVDGAQGAGAMEIDLEKTPFNLLAVTGHKHLFGPQGTGALIVKNPDELKPLMRGGTGSLSDKTMHPDFPPDKFEAGTLNTPGYAGLTAGIQFILQQGLSNIVAYEHHLTEYLLNRMKEIDEIEVYAPGANRVAIVSFNVRGMPASDVSRYLDKEWGICARAGLHCSPEAHKTIHTFPRGTMRFSLSCFNTKTEIDTAIDALKSFLQHLT
jgi:cysteine desulfurase/selenocysteine lyase